MPCGTAGRPARAASARGTESPSPPLAHARLDGTRERRRRVAWTTRRTRRLTLLRSGLSRGSSPGFPPPEGPRVASAPERRCSLTPSPVCVPPPSGAACKRPYSLLGLLSHLSPSAEVSRTQSAQRLFHEGTRLQEKSRAGKKV